MTSHYYPSYCTSASRVLYVDRISAGKNDDVDDVDFIYQFARLAEYEYENNFLKWGSPYLSGTPNKFPNYGNFPRTFCMVCVFSNIMYDQK